MVQPHAMPGLSIPISNPAKTKTKKLNKLRRGGNDSALEIHTETYHHPSGGRERGREWRDEESWEGLQRRRQ